MVIPGMGTRTRGKGNRRVAVGLFCISRARAEHLRCKILNPGASAISPTFSAGRTIEETRERKDDRESGGRGDRGEREGVGSCPRRGRRIRRGGSAARTQQVYI